MGPTTGTDEAEMKIVNMGRRTNDNTGPENHIYVHNE